MRKIFKKAPDIKNVVFFEVDEGPEALPIIPDIDGVLTQPRRRLLPKLPTIQDEGQKKALGNILKFTALVLIFTLVTRGTVGATLAKVDVVTPYAGEIVVSVSTTGTVQVATSHAITVPAGLTLNEVLVVPGQAVQAGDVLARLDAEEVAEAKGRAQLIMDEMNLNLQQLERGEPYDDSVLFNAQNALAWAQQDYDTTKAAGESAIAAAQIILTDAQTALAELEAVGAVSTEIIAATDAVTAAQTSLNAAIQEAESALQSAARAIEAAQVNLEAAQRADGVARQSAADTAAKNKLDAESLRLDIINQQTILDNYDSISDGTVVAEYNGIVLEIMNSGVVATESAIALISNDSGGYLAYAEISEQDAQKLPSGAQVNVTASEGYYGTASPSHGTLLSISAPNSEGISQITVKLPVGEWKHGQRVGLEAVVSRQQYQSCVPQSALGQGQDSYFVYIMDERSGVLGTENIVRKVPVTLLARDDSAAAIEGGVFGGDHIISWTSKALADGDKVRVRQL